LPRALLLLCLALLLQSCARQVERYFPSGVGTLNEGFYGNAMFNVPLDAGATLVINAAPGSIHPDPFPQIVLGLHVLIPEGADLQLRVPEVTLTSREWPEPKRLPVVVVEDWTTADAQKRANAPGAVIHGSAQRGALPGLSLSFVTTGPRSRTSIPAVESFEMRVSEMYVNGKPVAVEPVRFARQTKLVRTLGGPP
jgi:hypothetical protein